MTDQPNTTPAELVLRGRKTIRYVAIAIGNEMDRLQAIVDVSRDEDELADVSHDLGLYRAILVDMGDPR